MTQLAVSTQAEVMERAAPVLEEQTDYELARAAAPAGLIQIEGLLRVAPDDERLLLLGAKSWSSFAYAFVEDEMERAELAGDVAEADRQRARARDLYLKARSFGVRLLESLQPGSTSSFERDPDALKRSIAGAFTDPSAAAALFWAGYAWGSAIGVSRDDSTLLADLTLAGMLVERSVELDERYYHAAGHVFLGVVHSSRSASVGGDPERGRQHFEKALALTSRKALMVQLNYARYYAVQAQDRGLFLRLLGEVIDEPLAPGSSLSLANAIARRRAERLRPQADTLILEMLDGSSSRLQLLNGSRPDAAS
jgi:hypothetical protein